MSLLTDALSELAAVDGAYSWAGNNPVGMSDPSRRHPLTDAEFASWRDSHRTGLAAAGDRVAACDPVTGEARARTVTATASHDDVPVLRVRTDDGGAVETTATHPFWVEDRGWTPAGRLRAGDRLLTPDGRTVTVTATAPTGRTQRVYSLEVDGLQAYYVRAGTAFIAVHNECSELARRLQQRAQQLNDARGGWSPKYGTTAVIQAQAEIDGKTVITTFVATESPYSVQKVKDMLRKGMEEFVTGKGHAEETILRHLDKDKYTWRVIAGGTSRNVCRETCAPRVTGHGLELTGPEFRGRADKTPYRMFQIPGLGH